VASTRFLISAVIALLFVFSFAPDVESAEGDSLSIVITGGFRGRVDGCHCPSGSKGGMSPRVTLMKSLFGEQHPIALDCGGVLDLDPLAGRIRSECTIRALGMLGLRAAFVGVRDLFYGERFLRNIADSAGVKLVCANVLNSADGLPMFALWDIQESQGLRIAITGMAQCLEGQQFPGYDTWALTSPDSVIAEVRNSIPEDADLIVLLTDMSERTLGEFLPSFPEVDIVFTSSRMIVHPSPFLIGEATVINPRPDGGFIDVVHLPKNWKRGEAVVFESHPLHNRLPADETMDLWLKDCLAR